MEKIPRIGVGVIIKKDGKVLLGKRKASHGIGSWAPPGGHLEFNETISDCAKRETLEETGLSINDLRTEFYTEDLFEKEKKHYVTFLCPLTGSKVILNYSNQTNAKPGNGSLGKSFPLLCS